MTIKIETTDLERAGAERGRRPAAARPDAIRGGAPRRHLGGHQGWTLLRPLPFAAAGLRRRRGGGARRRGERRFSRYPAPRRTTATNGFLSNGNSKPIALGGGTAPNNELGEALPSFARLGGFADQCASIRRPMPNKVRSASPSARCRRANDPNRQDKRDRSRTRSTPWRAGTSENLAASSLERKLAVLGTTM